MKKIILALITLSIGLTSCQDWLDITTRSETRADALFSTEEGFKSALTGVYIKIAAEELYGANTSYLVYDALAQLWAENSSDTRSPIPGLKAYDYTEEFTEKVIKTIWEKYYNAIVQINNILENLDGSSVHFSYNNDKLILGECLALRAFLHFDLLRAFGPVPVNAAGKTAIPYVTQLTKNPNLLVSLPYEQVVTKIKEDFAEAEKILKEYDPIMFYSYDVLRRAASYPDKVRDDWQLYRQNRFNYYAVKATQARLHMWLGDTDSAIECADEVIKAPDPSSEGQTQFQFATESYFTTGYNAVPYMDLTLPIEHIFGAYNSNLETVTNKYFQGVTYTSYPLGQQDGYLRELYQSSLNPDDFRFKGVRYWDEGSYYWVYQKYISEGENTKPIGAIPIIRLAEMYLIMIECLPIGQAEGYFHDYRVSRNMSDQMDDLFDELNRPDILEREYLKEFYGEGQMFFFYKRKNYSTFTWPTFMAMNQANYVIPKPESQSIFE